MTRFVDVPAMAKLIQAIEVDEFIAELTDVIEANFVRWEEFDKAARFGAHNDEGVIELMPTSNAERYGFKYVNGHPENIKHDLFSVMGFGVLSDMNTGYPMLLSELTLATAMRTAATSVMAARALARKDSRVMAVIGNGAQAEFQAIGFHKVIGITEIRAFDIDPEATEKLARNLAEFEGLKVVHCNSVAEAVKGADIVTMITADKAMATIITAGMVEPGMHFNGVGGDCPGKTELAAGVLTQGKVFVEFEPQTRIEGDVQQMPADFPVNHLWKVLAGKEVGRDNDEQVTIFDSVGFAIEDFSTLEYIYKQSIQRGIGVDIELVPTPIGPKDLFTHTRRGQLRSVKRRAV